MCGISKVKIIQNSQNLGDWGLKPEFGDSGPKTSKKAILVISTKNNAMIVVEG